MQLRLALPGGGGTGNGRDSTAAAMAETDGGSSLKKRLNSIDKNETDRVDRISSLPEHIIHHIMAFLPTTDVTRISVWSQTFRSVWSSFPIIDFDYKLFTKTLAIDERRRMALFLKYVHDSILRRKPKTIIQKFRLEAGKALNLDHHMDGIIRFAIDKGVKELEIDLSHYRPCTYNSGLLGYYLRHSIASGKSITRLDLNDLILGCPMIENLSLSHYDGLKDVKVLSSKIRTIDLQCCAGLTSIEIESPSLQYFKYIGNSEPCEIKVVNWEFLKILSLQDATITDNWVENHVSELRGLENLELSRCRMLTNVKVSNSNLKKIELRFCIGLESIEIGALNLQSFVYSSTSKPCKVNIDGCKYLKNLSLKGPNITDEFLKEHISKLLGLENLILEQCHTLEMVEIFHEHLKNLHLLDCKTMVEVKVDTPELLSFMYKGKSVPFQLLNSTAVLDATLSIDSSSCTNGYFVMLRNFLGWFDHCKALTLVCSSDKDLIFPEELRHNLLPPLYDLKHLKVKVPSKLRSYTELVDSLLWLSPRPETLYFVSDIKEKSIKLWYGKMVGKEEDPFCCQDQPIKCWRHYLKTVEMENFEGVDDKDNLLKYFKENAKLLQTINFH